ncbi:hypothetical protein Dimus_020566 [Dionaea muscipula]
MTDKLTHFKERWSFARMLVEVDLAQELTMEIPIKLPGNVTHLQQIVYENLPKYCKGCCEIGHEDRTCWRACKPGPHLQKEPDNSEEIQQGNQQGSNVGHPEICDKLGIYCPTDNDAHIIQQEKMVVPRVERVAWT